MTTIRDVAAAAGVSPATVSRVLNGTRPVSPGLAQRVREAVETLGYRPNRAARALRTQVVDVWGVLVADIENPFFTSVVRALEDDANDRGYSVVLCNTDEDPVKEEQYLGVAAAERWAGVVIAVASEEQCRIDLLNDARIPAVAIDRRPRSIPIDSVQVDNISGARAATEHLLAMGCSSIACVTGPPTATTARERLAGYLEALESGGPHASPIVEHANFRESGGYDAAVRLLESSPRPNALFVANNLMALGVLRALHDLDVRVPDELALAVFDDLPLAAVMRPTITAVVQPTRDIGQHAARLLAERIAEPDAPLQRVVLPPRLEVRESSSLNRRNFGDAPSV